MSRKLRGSRRRLGAAAVVVLVALPFAFVGGPAGAANEPLPTGIGADASGRCTDPGYSDAGASDDQPAGTARLNGQQTVAIAGDPASGDLYIADGYWVRLVRNGVTASASSRLLTVAGVKADVLTSSRGQKFFAFPSPDETSGPARSKYLAIRGLVFNGGSVYLADVSTGKLVVRRLTPGLDDKSWGVFPVGSSGTEVTFDGVVSELAVLNGSLLVPEPEAGRIGTVRLSGGPPQAIESFAGGFTAPRSVAVDGAGNVYVGDAKGVHKLSPPYTARQLVGDFAQGAKHIAVDRDGTKLFVVPGGSNEVRQVNLKDTPGRSEVAMASGALDGFAPESLWWYGGSPGPHLYLGNCRPMRLAPLVPEPVPTTAAPTTATPTTAPPTTQGTVPELRPPDAPATNLGNQNAPVTIVDVAGSQGAAPAGQVNGGGQSVGAPGNALVTPPGGTSQFAGGAEQGGTGGGGAPPPPPINSPTPQPVGGPAPGSLLAPTPSPQPGLAAAPGNAPVGAPRYAMVRREAPPGPGPWVFAAGAAVLVGCVALCAIGLSRPRGGPHAAPATARAWARAW